MPIPPPSARGLAVPALLLCSYLPQGLLARGDGTFQAPFNIINAGRPGPAMVQSGDLNGDGKMDLLTANGSPSILLFFQSPQSRLEWKPVPLRVGSLVWFARAADFDGDGFDDIVAADISATAFYIRSLGNAGFERPVPLVGSDGARWTAVGDWNNDGNMDVATANINAANLTVFLGDGKGKFTLSADLGGSREHTLEALDYDGDRIMDLVLGTGLTGLTPHKGRGNGTFLPLESFLHMGCVEYLAEVGYYQRGKYVLVGDLDGDGRGDLAPTCIETTTVSVGVSLGDGTYRKTLETPAGPDVDSTAFADLNRDGKADLAVASKGSTSLLVYLGKGDGSLETAPVVFGPTGDTPSFLITRDFDGDGLDDLVSADTVSSTLTIFWGRKGERFLESAFEMSGHPTARAMSAADLDGDKVPDLFFARADQPEVSVYLKPGLTFPKSPSLTIKTRSRYGALETTDLDGDGVPDLVGIDTVGGTMVAALLDRQGNARGELALPAGLLPAAVEVGQVDEGATLDVTVPCKGSNDVAVFLGEGGGAFSPARKLPTVEKPRGAALVRLDGDAFMDLAVISDTALAVHYGLGGGDFSAPVTLVQDPAKLFTDVVAGDLDNDSLPDLAVGDSKTLSVLVFHGKGGREFKPPVSIKTNGAPAALALADLDGDGLLDLTISNAARSASIFLNKSSLGFPGQLVYGLGISPVGHRLVDLDLDGALDLVAFSAASAVVIFGHPQPAGPRFIRGDASADGQVAINDPILTLGMLFLGGEPLACAAAADGDDDGVLMVNDPILVLTWLFLGGQSLPPPGPGICGEDPNPNALGCSSSCP